MTQYEYNFFTFLGNPFFKKKKKKRTSKPQFSILWITTNSELMKCEQVTFDDILKFNLEKELSD